MDKEKDSQAFLETLWQAALAVWAQGGRLWRRREVDELVCKMYFGIDEKYYPDEYVEEAVVDDKTLYDRDDVLNALFGVWRLIYGGGVWQVSMVRRWIQRSLHLASYKMNPNGSRKKDWTVAPPPDYGYKVVKAPDNRHNSPSCDALASIDAGVDDLPIITDATNGSDSNVLRAGARTGIQRPNVGGDE